MNIVSTETRQRWSCRQCTHCCRHYQVPVTEEERRRIESLDWKQVPQLADKVFFVRARPLGTEYRLNQRKDGRCVFLGDDNLCLIHAHFGEKAKPLACRLFPFVLVPTGRKWRCGIRFACPSAAENTGRPVSDWTAELGSLGRELAKQSSTDIGELRPPPLHPRARLDWPSVERFVATIGEILATKGVRLERRWRQCLALGDLCRETPFATGDDHRFRKFLKASRELVEQVIPSRDDVPGPEWLGRTLYRHFASVYFRCDRGPLAGIASRGRLQLLAATIRFFRGRGAMPKLNGAIRDLPTADLLARTETLPSDVERELERYALVKVQSLQFAGSANHGAGILDGLAELALTFPLMIGLARFVEADDGVAAIQLAMRIVDDHFGYNPILGTRRYRWPLRWLVSTGELAKLIAWYGG